MSTDTATVAATAAMSDDAAAADEKGVAAITPLFVYGVKQGDIAVTIGHVSDNYTY